MSEFSQKEIEEIVKAMQEPPLPKDGKIPLRAPVAKVEFSELTAGPTREVGDFSSLKVKIEVIWGQTTLTVGELAALPVGALLPLEQEAEAQVEVLANGKRIGWGHVVSSEGRFGIKITKMV